MRIYSIHDKAAQVWSTPFFQQTDVHAIRTFTMTVNSKAENNTLREHAKDFDLYYIGEWNEDTGFLNDLGDDMPTPERKLLVNGEKVKKQE